MTTKKSRRIVSYRNKDETTIIGTAETKDKAVALAVAHLKELNIDEDDLEGLTWEQAVEDWADLTDGYEEFYFHQG